MSALLLLRLSETQTLQSAAAVAVGTEFGLPARAIQFDYQVVAAGTVTVLIQGSLDGSNWYTLATVAAAAAGAGTVRTSSKYVRSNITVNAGSSATVVTINPKAYGDILATTPRTVMVIAAETAAISAPADTTEDILATIKIKGGLMGRNGFLRVTAAMTVTSSANNKSLRARLGGIGGTNFISATVSTGILFESAVGIIRNRNSESAQVVVTSMGSLTGAGNVGTAVSTGAVDTSVDQDLVITGQKALGSETLTLEHFIVEVCHVD